MKTSIYMIVDPTGISERAYIGKTILSLEARLKHHLSGVRRLRRFTFKDHWLQSIQKRGPYNWTKRKVASAPIPHEISEQPKEEAMKRTTVLPNGTTSTTEGTPTEFAQMDQELMRLTVQMMNDEEAQEEPTTKDEDESNNN